MAETSGAVDDNVIQWVTFHLGNEVYGISVMQVMEVLRYINITPVPGAPDYVLGIINLRGNVVTVIDTRKRFSLPSRDIDKLSRIVIIESEGQVLGILVDCVSEVVYLKESDIEKAPNVTCDESSRFIHGVHSDADGMLILVDVDKLLTVEEWNEVSDK